MKIIIPENLDLIAITALNKPDFKFNIEVFQYLISLLTWIPNQNREYTDQKFIPLNSSILQKNGIRDFPLYRDYLEEAGIWHWQPYKPGEKSRAFRLNEKYQTTVRISTPPNTKFWLRIKRNEANVARASNRHKHLTKWFNEHFTIDADKAEVFAQRKYIEEVAHGDPAAVNRYNSNMLAIANIKDKSYRLTSDSRGRFYSPLTNVSTDLRQFISYNGERLTNIDIVNSQPFLSTVLFSPSFWQSNNREQISVNDISYQIRRKLLSEFEAVQPSNNEFAKINMAKCFNPTPSISFPIYWRSNLSQIDTLLTPSITNIPIFPNNNSTSTLMLTKNSVSLYSSDIQAYSFKTEQGEFYEYFQEKLSEVDSSFGKMRRSEIKTIFYESIFGKYIPVHQLKPNMAVFHKAFPNVSKFFRSLKFKQHNVLACALQSIEAELVIMRVAKKYSEAFPNRPIYTIHDSIVVEESLAQEATKIFRQELKRSLGRIPKLTSECWG